MQILEMLKEEGFKQITNRVTSVFFETSQRTFNELFGKYMSDVLIDNFFTSEIHGKREPFSSYDAFDRWLLDYFHADGTEKILQKIRQNI